MTSQIDRPSTPDSESLTVLQESGSQTTGTISGTVVDPSQAVISGAQVRLTQGGRLQSQEKVTDEAGQYWFDGVSPGEFQLTISAINFAPQTIRGTLISAEDYFAPITMLSLAVDVTFVRVSLSKSEIAEGELKLQESQRVLDFVPNYFVSYIPSAVPLNSRQKFRLALKYVVDPATFVITGVTAGIWQAQDNIDDYKTGASGYGKRYAASYANLVTGTFLGSAVFPSLLKQDPRYFYKGSGGMWNRTLYAMANAVICKGDNQHWQPNYSQIAGNLASGEISNFYYPSDKRGADRLFENAAIGLAETAVQNLMQEFVLPKLTPRLSKRIKNGGHGASQVGTDRQASE